MKEQIIKAAKAGRKEKLQELINSSIAKENPKNIPETIPETIGSVSHQLVSDGDQNSFDLVISSLEENLRVELLAGLIQYAAMHDEPSFAITTSRNIAQNPNLKKNVLAKAAERLLLSQKKELARMVLDPLANQNPERNKHNKVIDDRTRVLQRICSYFIYAKATPFLVVDAISCFDDNLRNDSRLQFSQLCLNENKQEILKAIINSADDQIKKDIIRNLVIINSNDNNHDCLEVLSRIFPIEFKEGVNSVLTKHNEDKIEQDLKKSKLEAKQYINGGKEKEFERLIGGLKSDEHKKNVLTNTAALCAVKSNQKGLKTVLECCTTNDQYVHVAGNSLTYAAQKGSDQVVKTLEVIDEIAAAKKEGALQLLKNSHGIQDEKHPLLIRLDKIASEKFDKIIEKAQEPLKKPKSLANFNEGVSERNSRKNKASKASEEGFNLGGLTISGNTDKKQPKTESKMDSSPQVPSKKPSNIRTSLG